MEPTNESSVPAQAAGEPLAAAVNAARRPWHGEQSSSSAAEIGGTPTSGTADAARTAFRSRRARASSVRPHWGLSAALFRALSEHTTDLVLILEADGAIRYASPSHRRLLGYTPAQMEGHNAAEFVHPADLPAVQVRTVATARTRDAVETMVFRIRHADGSWRTLEAVGANCLRDPAIRGWIVTSRDITDRKRAEQALARTEAALRQSEEKLRAIIDGSSAMICLTDLDGRYVLVNREVERFFGRERTTIEGQVSYDVLPAEVGDAHRIQDRLVIDRNAEVATEEQVCRDGELRTYLMHKFPLRDEHGAVCAIAGIATDITRRAQMDAALQERERQLAEAQRVAHLGSFEWDAVADQVSWSDELYRIYGLDPQSFGATFDAFVAQVHPDDQPMVLGTIRQAIAAGGPFRMQERIVRPGGEVRELSSWGEVVHDALGRPVRLVGICQDVTEQRRQEAALRASEARFRRLVDANIIGVIVADFGGAITDANDAFLQMVGYTCEEVAAGALHWDMMTPPEYRDRDEQAIHTLRTAGMCPAWEKEYIGKDGHRVPVLVGAALLEGTPDTYIAFVLDLTERKRAEDAIRHLNETLEQQVEERTAQLREANEQLEAFSYSVSHDLRAPLRAMQGFAAALLEDYVDRLDADGREYARRIDAAAARMDLLIADLLAYSRLSRANVAVQPVALDAVVASALAQLEEELRQRQARVHVTPKLPSVMAHYATLVQVVANLLTNAAKFVAPDTQPEVTVRAEVCGGWTRLWVADNGIGIAPEHRERIFGVFERLHGVETYPGTGIGLAIVRKGMERLGGRVGLESTVGGGSRFWIDLPPAGETMA